MDLQRVFQMSFAGVYPHDVNKAVRKGRTQAEVDQVICRLTGDTAEGLAKQIATKQDLESVFREAPALHPKVVTITGVAWGVRVEDVAAPPRSSRPALGAA